LKESQCSPSYSVVGVPQGMGRMGRLNQSVKEQGLRRYELEASHDLQEANERGPHQALGYLTPLEVVKSKLRAVQSN
jgi:transposase InsO family protein